MPKRSLMLPGSGENVPTLDDLLAQSMMFTAVDSNKGALFEVEGAFAVPRPHPKTKDLDEVKIRNNPVWQWKHEPAAPGTWRDVDCWSRGMGMNYSMPVPVCTSISWKDVKIVRQGQEQITLPLHDSFVVGTWRILGGKIREGESSLWGMGAHIDASMLVAFAYQLDGPDLTPLSRAECDELGDDLIPATGLRSLRFRAEPGTEAFVCVGPTRYVLALELVLCKEHDDYAPKGMVGMCRVHPHALFWSNEALESFEATVVVARPVKAMTHADDSMQEKIEALVVADCNEPTSPIPGLPWALADVLYDYYEVNAAKKFEGRKRQPSDHPRQQTGEICLADPRHTRPRPVEGGVVRHAGTDPWRDFPQKAPGQGQFDNVHLAPRMRVQFDTAVLSDGDVKIVPVTLDEIVMLFVCMHDCLHLHVRWGTHADEIFTRGWHGGRPHAKAGAPTVPENQVVFAKLPKSHVVEYRAVAEGCKPGALQVLCHHGLGYAVEEWPTDAAARFRLAMRASVELLAEGRGEPFNKQIPFDWPAFYWRFRFGGKHGSRPVERLSFQLEKCMR